jgi:hypothetical protein
MEKKWAPRDLPVFQLVPPAFEEHANALYANLGKPAVSSASFWVVYKQLLSAFRDLAASSLLDEAALSDDGGMLDEEVPLLPGLRDLRYGDDALGELGYVYYGGLTHPPSLEPHTESEEEEEVAVDLREFADFSD